MGAIGQRVLSFSCRALYRGVFLFCHQAFLLTGGIILGWPIRARLLEYWINPRFSDNKPMVIEARLGMYIDRPLLP